LTRRKEKTAVRLLRKTLAILLILFCLWLLLPLAAGIFHIGMIYPVILLLPLIVILWRRSPFGGSRRRAAAFSLCYAAALAFCLGTVAVMAKAAQNDGGDGGTVIVLGCKVRGSTPSRLLYDRCEAARGYLEANPDAVCVAAGGQGAGEDISEAESIFQVLTIRGVAPERIYLEESSTNTEENLANAAEIIAANGLSTDVVIATDAFHQFRAARYAKKAGLNPTAAPSATYLPVMPGYWAREILAVWKAILLR
jgi:uncharacterized SAM-binding protein YcdF (DUF218 family)